MAQVNECVRPDGIGLVLGACPVDDRPALQILTLNKFQHGYLVMDSVRFLRGDSFSLQQFGRITYITQHGDEIRNDTYTIVNQGGVEPEFTRQIVDSPGFAAFDAASQTVRGDVTVVDTPTFFSETSTTVFYVGIPGTFTRITSVEVFDPLPLPTDNQLAFVAEFRALEFDKRVGVVVLSGGGEVPAGDAFGTRKSFSERIEGNQQPLTVKFGRPRPSTVTLAASKESQESVPPVCLVGYTHPFDELSATCEPIVRESNRLLTSPTPVVFRDEFFFGMDVLSSTVQFPTLGRFQFRIGNQVFFRSPPACCDSGELGNVAP